MVAYFSKKTKRVFTSYSEALEDAHLYNKLILELENPIIDNQDIDCCFLYLKK